MFTYRSGSMFRRRVGAGQVLGTDRNRVIAFVSLFDVSGDDLRPFIHFLPILLQAYLKSKPAVIRQMDLPDGWEGLRDEWEEKWRTGEAGVFSVPLAEIARKTLETVNHFHDFDEDDGVFVRIAYPKKSASSGEFDTISATVQTRRRRAMGGHTKRRHS